MKIEIKKIVLENYKCFKDERKEFDFFHHTKITGVNKSGKSTIQDSYYDVLAGKMADGTQTDKIRPHDENGIDVDKVDCIRELEIEKNGEAVKIKKRTFQKWKNPKGQAEEIFTGNGVDYEVDGFPYKPGKFNEYISNLIKPDTMLLCSNANVFLKTLQSSTAEARKLLEELTGFSLERFVLENPQYGHVQEITKGHSVEDAMKKLKKQLSEQKKKIEEQNTKIKYEKTRDSDKERISVSDLELAKGEWREKLAKIDKEERALNESLKIYDDLSDEIIVLKKKRDLIASFANMENDEKRTNFEQQITEFVCKKKALYHDLDEKKTKLKQSEAEIQLRLELLEKARKSYAEWSAKKFDDSQIDEIELEELDESSLICPTCGQVLPENMKNTIKEKFEKTKKQRIEEQKSAKREFEESLELRLESIIQSGEIAKRDLEDSKKRKTDTQTEIRLIEENLKSITSDIERLEAELEKIPKSSDLSHDVEYMSVCNQIEEKQKELSSLDNSSKQRNNLREMRNNCMAELSSIDSRIQKINDDEEEKERNLSKLEFDLRGMSKKSADLERQIDMMNKFSRAKNMALAEVINPHFRHFQFSFLEYTIEGNPVETCKMMCAGTDFMKGLNGGDRKLCEIDLCRGLQELNGLCLPIWVDEANTIDPWRIPKDLEQQLILISRDDGELKVEEMA